VFYVEYLYLLEALSRSSPQRAEELLRQSFRELFFSWVEPDRACIFLESSRCAVYGRRPLACRLFGLVPPAERDQAEAEARIAARREAATLRRFGIGIPEQIVTRALVSCSRVRDRAGQPVAVDGEAIAARVARLDAALLPRQVVVEEFCFRSLPERIGAAALGAESIETLRLQLLRRSQHGEAIAQLVDMLLDQTGVAEFRAMACRRQPLESAPDE
jgi:hypothetical protein